MATPNRQDAVNAITDTFDEAAAASFEVFKEAHQFADAEDQEGTRWATMSPSLHRKGQDLFLILDGVAFRIKVTKFQG